MLRVIFGDVNDIEKITDKYECDPPSIVNDKFEDTWMKDKCIVEMVKDIDEARYIGKSKFRKRIFGNITYKELSGGVKTLMLMRIEPDTIINATCCGNNCAKWILKEGSERDVTVGLNYPMNFSEPFEIYIVNSDRVVKTRAEYMSEWNKYIFDKAERLGWIK